MLRLTLLIALPLVALCQISPELKRKQLKYLEEEVKPCILRNRNCPSDGRYAYAAIESVARHLAAFKSIKECNCDPSGDACLRGCYYAYALKMYLQSGVSSEDLEKAMAYLESTYKPCVLENKDCDKLGEFGGAQVLAGLNSLRPMFDAVPSKCNCDQNSESCIRPCYYAYLKKPFL